MVTAAPARSPAPSASTPSAESGDASAAERGTAEPAGTRVPATLLDPRDDVAMALIDLPAGTTIAVASAGQSHALRTAERIPAGHKFAVRAMGAGRRVRKYGEFIGRLTGDVTVGAWIHDHNLVTNARRSGDDERAWRTQAAPPHEPRILGTMACGSGMAPVFDAIPGKVYWLDAGTSTLFELTLVDGAERRWPFAGEPQALALAREGGLLVLTASGLVHFDPVAGATRCVGDTVPPPGCRWSGAQSDAHGRLWCGATHVDTAIGNDSLYVIDRRGNLHRQLANLQSPTGIAIDGAGTTLYFAEGVRGMIHACDLDIATGTLAAPRPFADLAAMPGELAGAAIDGEDHLWIALVDTGCLLRLASDGSVARVVRLPARHPTGCVFGGAGHREIFVTTARAAPYASASDIDACGGHLLALDVGVAGAPARRADIAGTLSGAQ